MLQYQLILVLFLPTPNLWIDLADGFLLIVKEVEPEIGLPYSLELSDSESYLRKVREPGMGVLYNYNLELSNSE